MRGLKRNQSKEYGMEWNLFCSDRHGLLMTVCTGDLQVTKTDPVGSVSATLFFTECDGAKPTQGEERVCRVHSQWSAPENPLCPYYGVISRCGIPSVWYKGIYSIYGV